MKKHLLAISLIAPWIAPLATIAQNSYPADGTASLISAPSWSGHNYGANLLISGSRNNAIAIEDSTESNPWAIVNTGPWLGFSKMPPLGDTTTAPEPMLVIQRNGYVGIGGSSPEATLDVAGTFRSQNDMYVGASRALYGEGVLFIQAMNNPLCLQTLTGGNVGIGTRTPQAKLDIEGGLRVSGTAILDGLVSDIHQTGGLSITSDGGSSTISHSNRQHIRAGEDIYLLAGENVPGSSVIVGGSAPFIVLGTGEFRQKLTCNTLELTSDRNQKQEIRPVSNYEILRKLVGMDCYSWRYTNSPSVVHIGAMAQDFKAAFGLGDDDKHIGAGDGIGVAFASIKGLHELVKEKDSEIAALRRELMSMKRELDSANTTVTDRLTSLEKALSQRNVQQAKVLPEAAR